MAIYRHYKSPFCWDYCNSLMTSCRYYANCIGYPSESVSSSKCHVWFASRCSGRRLSTWQMIAASCSTTLGALCGQLSFRLACCREHSAVTATELLQPLDLACGTLFQSSCAIQTSPTDYGQQRIEYKVCVLVYKCLHQAAPTYRIVHVSVYLRQQKPARGDLAVPRSRTSRYGQRSFVVSGPTLWNSLPLNVRDSSLTLTQFCTRLKTVLFSRAYATSS